MKKILLCVPLLAIFAAGFFGCSQQRQWNHEQRKAMREALRSYRQMVYLDDLNDAEFVLFSDEVAGQLENSYPVYMEFVQMQGVDDTVDMVVVSTIVDELNADARNMRHIYPYNYLVAQGVLPAGLDHEQQKAFYNCFAAKVNATYATMDQFFNAILADTSDMSQIRRLESQCANDLFSWVVTEVDVIETVPATRKPLPDSRPRRPRPKNSSGTRSHTIGAPREGRTDSSCARLPYLSANSDRAMPSSSPRSSASPRRRPRHEYPGLVFFFRSSIIWWPWSGRIGIEMRRRC